jgi:hypothetical protein
MRAEERCFDPRLREGRQAQHERRKGKALQPWLAARVPDVREVCACGQPFVLSLSKYEQAASGTITN